jgi:kynurenine formamidase
MCCHFVDTGISNEVAQYIRTKDVYGVGVDTPSIDPGKSVIFEAHQTMLGAQIFGIENLKLEKDVLPGKWLIEAIKYQMPQFITLSSGFHSTANLIMQLRCNQPDTVMMVTRGIVITPSVSLSSYK